MKSKITYYKNGFKIKLENRRVLVLDLGEDGYGIKMQIYDKHNEKRTTHEVKRGIVNTYFKLGSDTFKLLVEGFEKYNMMKGNPEIKWQDKWCYEYTVDIKLK